MSETVDLRKTETVDGVRMPRPLARKCYLRESDDNGIDGRHMFRVLSSIRDEIMGLSLNRHGGRSRELALVATKLDEARLWAIAYGESLGTTTVIDRREMLGGKPDADSD